MLIVMAIGAYTLAPELEQRLHGRVVLALADEDLSEVRVQVRGRDITLSGPEALLPAAKAVASKVPGIGKIELRIEERPTVKNRPAHHRQRTGQAMSAIKQIEHPKGPWWPPKKTEPVLHSSELIVNKINRNLEVSGTVPDNQVKQAIRKKLEQFIRIPERQFRVFTREQEEEPAWYLQDFPLLIPFIQWVEEGRLIYEGDRIYIMGIVPDDKARKALEIAIANTPPSFKVDERLEIKTKQRADL